MTVKLELSTGDSRLNPVIRRKRVSWLTLQNRLLKIKRTGEAQAKYLSMPVARQAAIKDVGYFVGGRFSGTSRKRQELLDRCVVTLDIDHLPEWDMDLVADTYNHLEYVLHSTHKHTPEVPRLRLVLPLSRPVSAIEYEPIARAVADLMGMDYFDDTTYQPARIMYWGSASRDADIVAEANTGNWLDPDELLARYTDAQDFEEWPASSREGNLRSGGGQISADPLTAPGIVGAFNRSFDIHAAIAEFDLPYEPTQHSSRYRMKGSSGVAGAVAYDDVFLYSHHESDPAGRRNCNAFDLVRLHRFGDWTENELADKTPMGRRAAYQQMALLAMEQDTVKQQMSDAEFPEEADKTEEPEDTKPTSGKKEKKKKKPAKLTYLELRQQIEALDPHSVTEDNLNQLVTRVAAARLGPTETDILASVLKQNWTQPAPQKASILKQIDTQVKRLTSKLSSDGEISDIERHLIETFLAEHFAGGDWIKRWAKQYWTYHGGVWGPCDEEWVESRVLKTLYRLREERPEDLLPLVASVGESKSSTLSAALSRMLRATLAGRENGSDPLNMHELIKPAVVNCQNGEIWFDSPPGKPGKPGTIEGLGFTFLPHDAAHNLTHQIGTGYDPRASAPRWEQFLRLAFRDKEDWKDHIRHLEEIMGYILQPDRNLKTWVLFHGEGYNGKSAIGAVLSELLGESSAEKNLADYGEGKNSHAETGLVGKLMLIDDDYAQGQTLPDGFIKRLSEAKRLTANPKFANEFRFVARAVPVILTNHWPPSRDTSLAIRERAQVIDFSHYIAPEERNEANRRHILEHELPGILNRLLAAYARLRARGHFQEPADCARARNTWLALSNPAAMFVNENLEEAPDNWMRALDVWISYRSWSRANNPSGAMLKKSLFFERMDSLIGRRVQHSGAQGYKGYKFTEDVEEF